MGVWDTAMRSVMRVVQVAVVVLAILRIGTQHPHQRSTLGFSIYHAAAVVLVALDDRLTTPVGARDGPPGAQSP